VDEVLLKASVNGGACLHRLGLHNEAAGVEQAYARPRMLVCWRGTKDFAAILAETKFDRARPLGLFVDLDHWANNPAQREQWLFHELLHVGLPSTHDKTLDKLLYEMNPPQISPERYRELDRVGSCERMCYGQFATKCECATCLGKKTCEGPCAGRPACFTNQIGGFCNCPKDNRTWYDSLTVCEERCSRGLGCFFARCVPEVNACKR
jgi:hypothetical protein